METDKGFRGDFFKELAMRPLIGVTSLWDSVKNCGWMWQNYMELIWDAGGMPMVLSLNSSPEAIDEALARCQGFLFTGGQDISPDYYDYEKVERCQSKAEVRDVMELALFDAAHKAHRPIFGICRGMQLINVALGGTLIEDIPSQVKTPTEHRYMPPAAPSMHEVELVEGSPLMALVGQKRMTVNSYHHQAVDRVAPLLDVMARSVTDQIVEAVWAPKEDFLMAVQWHPERIYQGRPEKLELIKRFIQAC